MSELLIEFFSEEIPPNLQISTRQQFKKLLGEKLFEANIKYGNFEIYSTPTRVSAHISELPDKIKILPAEIKGPKVGVPEKVLENFAKSRFVNINEIYEKKTDKGNFHFVKIKGREIDSEEELYRISNIPASDGLQGYTKYNYQTIGREKINENFTIYILSNLHRLNFRAVLAHEILHVYLFNNNISLKKSLIEGFCNLGSKFVYNSAPESKISELKLESMFINNHPEYGRGFRIMDAELERKGWAVLLKNLENY